MAEELRDFELEQNYGVASRGTRSLTLQTHQYINQNLSGSLVLLEQNYAKISLKTTAQMAVDEYDLIHGGFIFAAADFGAMAAINDPYVILSGAQTDFYAPVKAGDEVIFEAKSRYNDSRKRVVDVIGTVNEIKVFEGQFDAVVLEKHILKSNIKHMPRKTSEEESS